MGYYTSYSLDIQAPDKIKAEILTWLKKFDTDFYLCCISLAEPTKWDDWDLTLSSMSQTWPDVLFQLHGHGEDHDDQWIAFAYGGEWYQDYWNPPEFEYKKLPQYNDFLLVNKAWQSLLPYLANYQLPSLVRKVIKEYHFHEVNNMLKLAETTI